MAVYLGFNDYSLMLSIRSYLFYLGFFLLTGSATFRVYGFKICRCYLSEYFFVKDLVSLFQRMGEIPVFRVGPNEDIDLDDPRVAKAVQYFIKAAHPDIILNPHKYEPRKYDHVYEYAVCLYAIYCDDPRDWEELLASLYHLSGVKYGLRDEIGKDGEPVFWETVH